MLETILFAFAHIGAMATYTIIFAGMFVEGEFFLILAGILVRGQVIDYWDTITIAFCAVVLHDMGYWLIGTRLSASKRKKFLFINLEKAEAVFKRLGKRQGLYLFMSKFAWGMNRFVLLSSGYFATPFKKLVRYSIPAAFVWTTTFVSLGYMFAERAGAWKKDIRAVLLFAAALFALLVYIEHQIGKSIEEEALLSNGNK